MPRDNFFVYILTNPSRSVLYIGVTNDLVIRLTQHYWNKGEFSTFAGRYYCNKLVYYERYQSIIDAIDREKEIKKWSRKKKDGLIKTMNPDMQFLNTHIMPWPPPKSTQHR